MSEPRDLRDVTLGDLEEVIASLDVGALSPEQHAQLFRVARRSIEKIRSSLPPGRIRTDIALAVAGHALTEIEHAWLRAAGVPRAG